jgi:hypothetical protein
LLFLFIEVYLTIEQVGELVMSCPLCGYEEKTGSVCSQCHASLPTKIEKPVAQPVSLPTHPKPPISPSSGEPPKEKFRRRPLMDLDLTIPELETEEEIQARLKESNQKDKKS